MKSIAALAVLAFIGLGSIEPPTAPQETARVRAMIEINGKRYLVDIQGTISIQDVTPSPGGDDEDPPGDSNQNDTDKGGDPGGLSSVIDGDAAPGPTPEGIAAASEIDIEGETPEAEVWRLLGGGR